MPDSVLETPAGVQEGDIAVFPVTVDDGLEAYMDICEAAELETPSVEGVQIDRKLFGDFLRSFEGRNDIVSLIAWRGGKPTGLVSVAMMPFMPGLPGFMVSYVLLFYVIPEARDGRAAHALLEGLRRWSVNRRAPELHLHVTSGIRIGKTHKTLRRMRFHSYGVNFITRAPLGESQDAPPEDSLEVVRLEGKADLAFMADIFRQSNSEGIHALHRFDVAAHIEGTAKSLEAQPDDAVFCALRAGAPVGYTLVACRPRMVFPGYKVCRAGFFYTVSRETRGDVEAALVQAVDAWRLEKQAYELTVSLFEGKRMTAIGNTLRGMGLRMIGGNYALSLGQATSG